MKSGRKSGKKGFIKSGRYDIESMRKSLNDENLKRRTLGHYKLMGKKRLLLSLSSFIVNLDKQRRKVVDLQLEINFLTRRIAILENKLRRKKENESRR